MLEKMDDFFNSRLSGYEAHQLNVIESATEFYPFTASCLPGKKNAHILDLGCGTGLELGYYYDLNPTAKVTGIDMAADMLNALEKKFAGFSPVLIHGSYFTVPFGNERYDAAVSVESLHHFTSDEKLPLYKKLLYALRTGGFFILTDYFASSDEEERHYREEYARLRAEQGINDDSFYHYDTPLTLEHEIQTLRKAGFISADVIGGWGATHTIKAVRR